MPTTADPRLDRLYQLLPMLHRLRDHEQGQPLRAFLQVIAEQVNLIEDDIEALYDNWFIETCDDWVVPYLGDLVGYEPAATGPAGDPSQPQGRALNRVLSPRREVANTLRYRRRKGTLALLEELARDVAGWPARAVEYRQRLARTASADMGATAAAAGTVDLRNGRLLDRLDSAFDQAAHLPEMRRIASRHDRGRLNIPNVGLHVWRLRAYSVTHAPACCIDEVGPHCYTFSALGNDAPLFNRPRPEADAQAIAGELNLPLPIDRRAFSDPSAAPSADLSIDSSTDPSASTYPTGPRASADYYDEQAGSTPAQSLAIWAEGWLPGEVHDGQPIPRRRIVPADLGGWSYLPREGEVAVDPVRGRLVFPPRQLPRGGVTVSYHYGFSADIGGGGYERPLQQEAGAQIIRVQGRDALREALGPWRRRRAGDAAASEAAEGAASEIPSQPEHAVIEIGDSGVYVLPVDLALQAGHTLQIRAAQRKRPILRLLDWKTSLPDGLTVTGEADSRFTLDGMMVAGRGVRIEGALRSFTVRHTTLVPGWSLDVECEPQQPAEPSIELTDSPACIVIEHSIVGSIQVNNNELTADPNRVLVSDSVVDATGVNCDKPECEAIGAAGSRLAHVQLRIARSTVIGRVMVHAIELAEDSLLLGRVNVARRQIGCIRFCYVRPGSRTPRRFACQPDGVEAVARERLGLGAGPDALEAELQLERNRVRPLFGSRRYGTPTYCQLAPGCAAEIVRGAHDESEMGVFHDLYQPQRLSALQQRLDEFVPAATEAAVILAS